MLVHPQFDPIAVQVGPLAVHWYGLMYLIGFTLFYLLGLYRCRQEWRGITKANLEDLLFVGMVGVIVGGAFTAIVTSLNQDILTPVLAIFGGTDFSNLYVKLGSGDTAPVLMYGNFITAVINFLITAFVIFCLVKFINKLGDTLHHKEETPAAPTTKKCPFCKSEIAIDATRCPHCTSKLDEQ